MLVIPCARVFFSQYSSFFRTDQLRQGMPKECPTRCLFSQIALSAQLFKFGLNLDGAAVNNWSDAAAWELALPERVPDSVVDRRRLRTRTRDQNGLLFISIILPEMLVLRMYSSSECLSLHLSLLSDFCYDACKR